MTSAVLKRRAATLKNLNKRKKTVVLTDDEELHECQQEQQAAEPVQQQLPDEGEAAQECPDLEGAFEQIARDGFNRKLERKGLEYLRNFKFMGAKPNTSGGVAMIECEINKCGVRVSYNIRGGTTSNVTKHLRKHGLFITRQGS